VFVREPFALPPSIGSEWIREFSGAGELAAEADVQLGSRKQVTTNKTPAPGGTITDLLRGASARVFNASNIIAGISLMAVVGISEKVDLTTTTKVGFGKVRSLTFGNSNTTGWDIRSIHPFLASIASTTNEVADQVTSSHSRLIDSIIIERSVADIDAENVTVANAATSDAVAFIQDKKLSVMPHIMFSEDGILALQWQHGPYGVALVFAGNGVASISFRRPGQFYAENGIDVRISDSLPREFSDALANVLA
jgi:hypothetical protein